MDTPCREVSDRQTRRFWIICVVLALLGSSTTLLTPHLAEGAPSEVRVLGQWSAPFQTGFEFEAPHLVVLRHADSTRILSWRVGDYAKLWYWNDRDSSSAPYVNVPLNNVDIFCSGHSALSNGTVLVSGGTFVGNTGGDKSYTFDPASRTWTARDTLAFGRWYPTSTTLGNGNVVISSGQQYFNMVVLGGLETETTALNEIRPLALKKWQSWSLGSTLGGPPAARSGHVAVERRTSGQMVMYGGRTASGVALDDVWVLNRLDSDAGVTWRWADTTNAIQTGYGQPGARSGHSAVLSEKGDTLWIFGGKGPNSEVYNDVWRLPLSGPLRWEPVTTAGAAAPAPRYGHTAALDPGQTFDPDQSKLPVMVVYGGRNSGGSPADTVWGLSLRDQSGTPTWSVLATGGPPSRSGHAAVMDPFRAHNPRDILQRQMVVFGGEGVSGYLDDLWVFSRLDQTVIPEPWSWHQVTVPSGPRPAARTGHAAIYDAEMQRLTLFGGDTSLTPGGFTNDTWAISMWSESLTTDQTKTAHWVQLQPNDPPSARMGHTALFESVPERTRIPERFTLSTGHDWERLDNAPKLQPLYPFMFLQSDGKLAEVGPGPTTRRLDLSTQSWTTIATSPFDGGSAVMYRPGLVMKCGEQGGEGAKGIHGKTAKIDLAAGSPAWTDLPGQMVPRANHNLTVLPTGQVLATGGLSQGAVYRNAQLWDPITNLWSIPLAADLAIRKYHSAAALLPDGRVLSTGGDPSDQSKTIYTPPYLFKPDSSGELATRPVITAKPESLGWGKTFTICTPEAASILNACLIKPSAVTHSFNQDQRYLPLAITAASNPARLLAVAPASGNHAPPGDYLLFVVNQESVPAIAKWVRIGSPAGLDLCDAVRPNAISDLVFDFDPVDCTLFHLSWTAPGDDANLVASGPATQYNLKSSSSSIDSVWAGGTTLSLVPGTLGTAQTTDVTVGFGQSRYFRIKTRDDNNNWSWGSNQIHILGPPLHSICAGGEGLFAGGGGLPPGSRLQPAAAAASLQPVGATWSGENSLLNGVPAGTKVGDLLRLSPDTPAGSSTYLVRIREAADHAARMDAARLLTVDHSSTVMTFMAAGRPVLGNRVAPLRATDGAGTNVTALIDGSTTDTFAGDSGAVITVELRADPAVTPDPVVIEASGLGWSSSGILLQVPDGSGGWRTVDRVHPRLYLSELAVDSVASSRVRLFLLGRHQVRFVGRVARSSERPTVQWGQLLKAQDSRSGDALPALSARDSASLTLVGPDTLTLSFAAPPLAEGQVRECFLAVDATPLATVAATASPLRGSGIASLPTRFALWQNQPNPFEFSTTIRFDLPVGALVRLEVFDVQGRRVKLVTNHYYPAGYQAVQWDRRDEGGGAARPSVYLYRLTAGSFRAQRKMVLLP
jgi:hypothetical protein